MAMVRGSGVMLGIGMLMLSGCFLGYDPFMANALDVPLEVIVRYADGDIRNIPFNPGDMEAIGKRRDVENDNAWPAMPIEEVAIKEAGQLLHQFNAEEVRLLIEKQVRDWGFWCIDREKVYLAQSPNTYTDARELCSKGNRLWTWENGRFYKGSRESP